MEYILILEYYSGIKKEQTTDRCSKWINLTDVWINFTDVMLNESQTPKAMYCMIPLTRNFQNRQIYSNSTFLVAQGWKEGRGVVAKGCRVSFRGDVNVLN